jgi:hypothetical protein
VDKCNVSIFVEMGRLVMVVYDNTLIPNALRALNLKTSCYGAFGIEVGIPIFAPTFLHFLTLLGSPRYRSHV